MKKYSREHNSVQYRPRSVKKLGCTKNAHQYMDRRCAYAELWNVWNTFTRLTLLRGVIILSSPLLQAVCNKRDDKIIMDRLVFTSLLCKNPLYILDYCRTWDERWLEKTETHAIFQLNLNFFNFKSLKLVLYRDKETNDQIRQQKCCTGPCSGIREAHHSVCQL